jgi:hypothetical protein
MKNFKLRQILIHGSIHASHAQSPMQWELKKNTENEVEDIRSLTPRICSCGMMLGDRIYFTSILIGVKSSNFEHLDYATNKEDKQRFNMTIKLESRVYVNLKIIYKLHSWRNELWNKIRWVFVPLRGFRYSQTAKIASGLLWNLSANEVRFHKGN